MHFHGHFPIKPTHQHDICVRFQATSVGFSYVVLTDAEQTCASRLMRAVKAGARIQHVQQTVCLPTQTATLEVAELIDTSAVQVTPTAAPGTASAQETAKYMAVLQWLAASYWQLPTDAHRDMFLHAAKSLHGKTYNRPDAAWVTHLEDKSELSKAAVMIQKADTCLQELIDWTLVGVDNGRCVLHTLSLMSSGAYPTLTAGPASRAL